MKDTAVIVYPNYGADFIPYVMLFDTLEEAKKALEEEYERDLKLLSSQVEYKESYVAEGGTFACLTFRDLSEVRYEVSKVVKAEAKKGE